MPQLEIKEQLKEATSEVLETMCFLEIDGIAEDRVESSVDWRSVSVHFSGRHRGKLWVSASPGLARTIASNLLGEEPDQVDQLQITECLGEIANMICGGLVHKIDMNAIYDLDHPEVHANLVRPLASVLTQTLKLENGFLCVWVEWE